MVYEIFLFFNYIFSHFDFLLNKSQLIYLGDIKKQEANSWVDFSLVQDRIESGDILKVEVNTSIPEASLPYNLTSSIVNQNLELIKLEGYIVDDQMMINFPVLGKVNTNDNLNEKQLELKIKTLLIKEIIFPTLQSCVRRINNKFTVLGEVKNPGTFSYSDKKINVLQALGYAGDLTIDGKRKDITLIRDEEMVHERHNIELTKSEFLNSPLYTI